MTDGVINVLNFTYEYRVPTYDIFPIVAAAIKQDDTDCKVLNLNLTFISYSYFLYYSNSNWHLQS